METPTPRPALTDHELDAIEHMDTGALTGPDAPHDPLALELDAARRKLVAHVKYLRAELELAFSPGMHLAIQTVLDKALGTQVSDGSGQGIAADVALLAERVRAAERTVAKVDAWTRDDVVTANNEFGNGYRECQRDIRDLISGASTFTYVLTEPIRDAIRVLADQPCVFWACPGPDRPFEDMVTCRICAAVQELRAILTALGADTPDTPTEENPQ